MKKALTWIERVFFPNLGVVFFSISCLWMFIEAVSRKFFNHSFAESEEIISFSLAWAILLTLAESGRTGHHIRISMLAGKLSPLARRCFNCLNAFCGLVYTLLLTCSAFLFIVHLKGAKVFSYSPMRLPLWVVYIAVLVGGALLFLYYLEKLVLVLRGREETIDY